MEFDKIVNEEFLNYFTNALNEKGYLYSNEVYDALMLMLEGNSSHCKFKFLLD